MNCAAIPAELVESELFGHEKGSFSGALAQRRGRFEQADGGTLFLDEIGDMPVAMQAKLLRVLEDGEVTRVGGSGALRVSVRVISATNRPLEALLQDGRFREDLLYRINTLSISTPPLRQRPQDVAGLVSHFAAAACQRNHWRLRTFSPGALDLLGQQPWRGNVRELRNVVERLLILAQGEPIAEDDVRSALPLSAPAKPAAGMPANGTLKDLVDAFESEVIRERVRQSAGHITNAARSLGLERSHLYKKCKLLGIDMRSDAP
jgi:two-component system, NtrC family, nitrogen regulation response regulator NtrX